jgi:hypothetical protein
MSINGEQQMNVAKPALPYRIAAWCVVLPYLLLACFGLRQVQREGMREHVLGLALILAVLCLLVYVLVRTHGVYRWNDGEIQYRSLFGTRSMRWDEIVKLDTRRFLGGWTRIILRDAWDKRLVVYSHLLPEASVLHSMLTHKLGHLEGAPEEQIKGLGETHYFPVGIRDLRGGTFIVRGDKLVHKGRRRIREVVLSEVQYVYRSRWNQAEEVIEVVSPPWETIEIPSATKGYDRLVGIIRMRAKNAVWVNMSDAEPRSLPEEIGYLKHRIEALRKEGRQKGPLVWLIVVVIVLAVLDVAMRSGLGWFTEGITIRDWAVFIGIITAVVIAVIIWRGTVGVRDELRWFELRLGSLEGQEAYERERKSEGGVHESENRE